LPDLTTNTQLEPVGDPNGAAPTCPGCGLARLREFYCVESLPVHSCLMLDSREEAEAYPRRPLRLAICDACGFITNTAFEPASQEFSARYQDQQGCSPRFRAYQTECIRGLIERFDLHGRDVIEIGCGKGDFLVELCQAGGNRGVGIDPRCESYSGGPGVSVRFLAERFSSRHAALPCDFLCCRHTLEHIPDPQAFLATLRETLGRRHNTVVFFEVPDTARVLAERAFWDMYYEHCSYFTAGSLARLFRANGFEILDLQTVFAGQYLTLVARPTDAATRPRWPQEDDLAWTLAEANAFATSVHAKVETWRTRIAAWRAAGKGIFVWAAGSKCVAFLGVLGCADQIEGVVDINPSLHGRFLAGSGKQVLPPDALRTHRPDIVVVMNPVYEGEVRAQLADMGLRPEVLPL
jgi:hypothetical protein